MYMLLSACTPKAQSITYGADMCHFCKMNIVDVQHASEIVTKKGKVFKYDAIECMLNSEEPSSSGKKCALSYQCVWTTRDIGQCYQSYLSHFRKVTQSNGGQSYCL